MKDKRALITGISGQDASYLAESIRAPDGVPGFADPSTPLVDDAADRKRLRANGQPHGERHIDINQITAGFVQTSAADAVARGRSDGWSPGHATPRHRDLPGIQYLRGLAALCVVFHHTSAMEALPWYFGRGRTFLGGAVGVDLFFCLSGFIIVYVSLNPNFSPSMSLSTFAKKRFSRIVPFLWFCVVAYGGLRLVGRNTFEIKPFLRAMTLFPVGKVHPEVVWTLRHEFLFYAVFGLTFLAGRRRRWLLAAWAASPVVLAMCGMAKPPESLAGFFFSPVNVLFGIGAVVGLSFLRFQDTIRNIRIPGLVLIACVALTMLIAQLIGYDRYAIAPVLLIGFASAVSVLLATAVSDPHGLVGSVGKVLGDASYSVYLTHLAVISATLGVMSKHWHTAPETVIVLGIGSLAVIVGIAVHYVVERPLVARMRHLAIPGASLRTAWAPRPMAAKLVVDDGSAPQLGTNVARCIRQS